MALTGVAALISAWLVYALGPWWGAPVKHQHRLWAALLTGITGVVVGSLLKHPVGAWWFMPMIALLVIVAVVDRIHQIIPNRLVLLTAAWALVARIHDGHWLSATLLALAVFSFYLAINVVTRGGMGMGDVKFSAVLALALGYPLGIISVVVGMWAAGIYAAFLLVLRQGNSHRFMALGPFLAIGGLAGLLMMLHG